MTRGEERNAGDPGTLDVAPTPDHEKIARSLREHRGSKGLAFNAVITLVEVGGAIALFHLARNLGASNMVAYLVGGIGPVIGGIAIWARARRLSGASVSIFAFTALSALVAVVGNTSPKALLYKDCATTGLIGVIFLASAVVARKPLVFYMAQRYGTDGTHEGMATFDTMWATYRDFRIGMQVINGWWAVLYLAQAAGTALIVEHTAYSTGYNYDQILPIVASVLGVVGSVVLGRYYARRP